MKRASKKTLFVISLNYVKNSLPAIDASMKEHMFFLQKYYQAGNFLVSGRKDPRTGGIVIAKADNISDIRRIMREDPFYIKKLSRFSVTQFFASQHADLLEDFLGGTED